MRYILDDNGYIESVSCTPIVCNNKGCTEYTGNVPEGYSSIEEWATTANVRAYKVVNGQLVYDSAKDTELSEKYKKESYTYSTTEQKIGTWIDGKPIYRRSFAGNTGTSAQVVITSAYNNNTIRVVNAYGSIRTSSGGTNIGSYVNGNYYSVLFIHSNELQLYFGSSLKSGTYMITIEFTKTSD